MWRLTAVLLLLTACVSGRGGFNATDQPRCVDASVGQSRWNADLNMAEICDGQTWRGIAGELNASVLLFTPSGTIQFAVTGSGNPARSAWTTVAVRNVGNVASAPLVFDLSNERHFEVDAAGCEGVSLAPGAQCDLRLRAQASATAVFEGVLVIGVDNHPLLQLAGNATSSCPLGESQAGGSVAQCAQAGYYLIAAPAGCDAVAATPDCSPLIDHTRLAWGPDAARIGVLGTADGPGNTAAIMSVSSTAYAAARYCDELNLEDYDDWYLPASNEMVTILEALGTAGGAFAGGRYWSSTEDSSANAVTVIAGSRETGPTYKPEQHFLRCARRDFVTPLVAHDPCAAGSQGAGGLYIGCGEAYDLVMQPAGCDGSLSEPTCDGMPESVTFTWGARVESTTPWARDAANGAQNSVDLQALAELQGLGSFPAAEYCTSMVYNGYSDWYLPAPEELNISVLLQRSGVELGLGSEFHWSSKEHTAGLAIQVTAGPKASGTIEKRTRNAVRCVRREGRPLPASSVPASGCRVGREGAGGVYFSCGSSVDMVVAPGGCESSAGPCNGGDDTILMSWGSSGVLRGVDSSSAGATNTARLDAVAGVGNHPAAEFCAAMVLDGFSDWYLPAVNESQLLVAARNFVGGMTLANYWTSTESGASQACFLVAPSATFTCETFRAAAAAKSHMNAVRCIRADYHVAPADLCAVGEPGPGGVFAVCNNEYNLVFMPSGCDGTTTTPACMGDDGPATQFAFGGSSSDAALDDVDGPTNTIALDAVAGVGARPAAEYCANMFFGGHDDWYLPAVLELATLMSVAPVLGGFSVSSYWSSTVRSADTSMASIAHTGTVSTDARWKLRPVRCARRDR